MKGTIITLLAVIVIVSQVALVTGVVIADPSNGDGLIRGVPPSGPDLMVNGENPWTSKVFEVSGAMPGDWGETTIELQNVGDEKGSLYFQIINLVDNPNVLVETEPTPDLGELSQNLNMLIWIDDGDNIFEWGEVIIAQDTLYNIVDYNATSGPYYLGALYPEITIMYVGICWWLDCDVGPEAQEDECTFDIQFMLD